MSTEWKSKDLDLIRPSSNLCRLCAKVNNSLCQIFSKNSCQKEDRIHLLIKKCLPKLKVVITDSKPHGVCDSCISKLEICGELIETSLEADSTFDEILKTELSIGQKNMEPSSSFKTVNDFYWMDPSLRHDRERLGVAPEGNMIVVGKLPNQDQTHTDQDFVVMLEVKYKGEERGQPTATAQDVSKSKPNSAVDFKSSQAVNHLYPQPSDKYYLLENSFCDVKSTAGAYLKRETGVKKFECNLCEAKFTRMTRLRAHHATAHTTLRPHSCDQCGAGFALRWDLTLHQRLHARTFQCDFCLKSFPARNKLVRHRRTHTGERPFPCTLCDKAFGEKRNLDNHIRTHTGERPFECDVCFKRFRVSSHLREHQRVHAQSAQSSYSCTLCERQFKWKANYSVHMKSHQ